MIKKIFRGAAKILLGAFAFYLFLALVVVPLAGPWAVASQGSKALKHPVRVKSVFFNPFLFRLTVNGLSVYDAGNHLAVGFDKFWADVSFIRFFRKELRVESLGLDGLKVNAELSPEGKVNLLDLAPPPAAAGAPAPAPAGKEGKPVAPAPAEAGKPLPPVFVDLIVVRNGAVHFTDKSLQPNFNTTVSGIDLRVEGISTKPDARVKAVFQAALDEKGTVATETLVSPFVQPMRLETAFSLNNYALQVLNPYVGKYTGRAVKDGKLDLNIAYRIEDNQLKASHKILVQRFGFGEKVPSKNALNLPFGLAVGLLEDPQGRINISLPVTGDISKPEFDYFRLVGQVTRSFFIKLVTKPLGFLMSLAGAEGETGTEETSYVRFFPGTPDLSDEDKRRLLVLVKGLNERPKLRLEINGSYDPQADWQAMRARTFESSYLAMRKESKRSDSRLIRQLYEELFGLRSCWELENKLKAESGRIDQEKLDAEMKRRLVEEAPNDQVALNALAKTRAQLVYDFITAEGFDGARVSIGANRQTQSSMGYVPLEFGLKVFDDITQPAERQAPVFR